MRPIALSLLLLCACSSLDSQQQQRLDAYKRQAALYFEGQKWSQAMGQIERGLELDPDDYKLNSMKGGILLLFSGDSQGTDHKKLDEATAMLATQFAQRSVSRHEPHLLLNYASALQKQGLRHLGEAVRLEGGANRTPPPADADQLRAKAAGERAECNRQLDEADSLFAELVQRGEMTRLAHNHRLQIALQRSDDKRFLAEAEAYFAESKKAQDLTDKRIDQTTNADYERDQMVVKQQLRDEELEVRSVVAQFHYTRKNWQLAKDQLDRVLELDPRRFVDYYNRGRALLELGKHDAAKEDFRRFLADPSVPVTSDKAVFALQVINR